MKPYRLAQALGATLVLALAITNDARAEAMSVAPSAAVVEVKQLSAVPVGPEKVAFTSEVLTPTQFNALFAPNTDALGSMFNFVGSPVSGSVRSQVFQGKPNTSADGLYAYAYQVSSNPLDLTKSATSNRSLNDFDGVAFRFNATPVATDFAGATKKTRSYQISGPIGGLVSPSMNGSKFLAPAFVTHQAILDDMGNPVAGSLAAAFDPTLQPSNTSATFVVMTKEKPDGKTTVNLRSIDGTTSITEVYKTAPGEIIPNPVPEPATVLAWTGMLAAFGLARTVRRRRQAV